jgi:hypothetical protein
MQMGIGKLGDPATIIKRKFRYTLKWETPVGEVPEFFVKVARRPQLDIDDTELHFLNAITWIPGKGRWQPLSVTYIDVAHRDMQNLYNWISSVYDFNTYAGINGTGNHLPQSEKAGWNARGIITIFDGCGTALEQWTLLDCFPTSINFGELDYAVSDECNIELTVRFARAKLTGLCGPTPIGLCRGCGNG